MRINILKEDLYVPLGHLEEEEARAGPEPRFPWKRLMGLEVFSSSMKLIDFQELGMSHSSIFTWYEKRDYQPGVRTPSLQPIPAF